MKIIIVGDGKVGFTLAEHLSQEEHDITVIDTNDAALRHASEALDVMCVKGNGASISALRESGVDAADVLIAATSMDEVNMVCCLTAKRLGAKYTIARIRDVAYTEDLASLQKDLAIDAVINPEYATALEISRLLRLPAAANVDTFFRGKVEMIGVRVREEDPIVGHPLSDLFGRASTLSILFSAAERKGEVIIPDGSFVPRPGDKLFVTGTPKDLSIYLRSLGRDLPKVQSAFLIGGSRIAHYLSKMLLSMGVRVTLVENDEEHCRRLSEWLPGALVLYGDGTDQELLASEHFANNDAFVALTGLDEANILMALSAAKQSGDCCKVVAKINRKSLLELVSTESLIDSVVSTGAVTTELILQYIRAMKNASASKVKTLHRIVDEKVEALEFSVTPDISFAGVPLRDLNLKRGLLLAGIVRQNGQIVIPSGNDVLHLHDDVIVVTTDTQLEDLRDILAE